MRRYSRADEENIRTERLVREWTASGFLDAEQRKRLLSELQVDLRRTNKFLRLVLFGFGLVVVAAAVILMTIELTLRSSVPFFLAAVACFVAAEFLAGGQKLYRFGIEEAFAASAVILAGLACAIFTPSQELFRGLVGAAVAALVVYLRFGYVYAAAGSMACMAFAIFQLRQTMVMERVLVVAALFVIFVVVRSKRRRYGDEFPGDEYGIIQAVAWAGMYVAINIHLFERYLSTAFPPGFYWGSYTLTWLLTAAGLYLALRDKDRPLLNVNLAVALTTFITNKSYLGMTRQTWDPILFGLFLTGTAIVVRRWLANGPSGQQYGFTPSRLLLSDKRAVDLVGTASGLIHPQHPSPEPSASEFKPGGGRSGGAGASGEF